MSSTLPLLGGQQAVTDFLSDKFVSSSVTSEGATRIECVSSPSKRSQDFRVATGAPKGCEIMKGRALGESPLSSHESRIPTNESLQSAHELACHEVVRKVQDHLGQKNVYAVVATAPIRSFTTCTRGGRRLVSVGIDFALFVTPK